jgi:hypothetical protein
MLRTQNPTFILGVIYFKELFFSFKKSSFLCAYKKATAFAYSNASVFEINLMLKIPL